MNVVILNEVEARKTFAEKQSQGVAAALYRGRPAHVVGRGTGEVFLVQWDEELKAGRTPEKHPLRACVAAGFEGEVVEEAL